MDFLLSQIDSLINETKEHLTVIRITEYPTIVAKFSSVLAHTKQEVPSLKHYVGILNANIKLLTRGDVHKACIEIKNTILDEKEAKKNGLDVKLQTTPVERLQECLSQIDNLKTLTKNAKDFVEWRLKAEDLLIELFGTDSKEVNRFKKIHPMIPIAPPVPDHKAHEYYVRGLEKAEAILKAAMDKTSRNPSALPDNLPIISDEVLKKFNIATINNIVREINGCYKDGYYGACSVMCRKVVEAAIHIKFKREQKENVLFEEGGKSRDKNLSAKINLAQNNHYITSKCAKDLKNIKWFGDSGAHNYKINFRKDEIKETIKKTRFFLEEIFHED